MNKVSNHIWRIVTLLLTLTVGAGFSAAHLDAGFDQTAGPYLVDVGWTPTAPAAGESVLIAVNVLDAATKQPANESSVWLRFDIQDQVAFAGNVALNKGASSLTFIFPKAGVWNVTVRIEKYQASGEVWVPGETATGETRAWLLAAGLGIATTLLGVQVWKSRSKRR